MNADWYSGVAQERRRRNSGRYEQDQEFGRRRRHGGGSGGHPSGGYRRRAREDSGDYYPEPDQGYADSGWHEVGHDPRGATDPYGGTDPYQGTDPYGGPDPRGGPADYYEPYTDRGHYPPEAGYPADDQYGGAGYGGHDQYDGQGWNAEQRGYGDGRDGYDDPGYGRDAYHGDYDDYGQPAHGYPADERYATADDDPAGWRPDGVGSRGYEPESRLYRGDAGDARPAGGSGRSRRAMEVEEDRHSGFFSGFANDDNAGYRKPRRRRRIPAGMVALIIIFAIIGGIGYAGYHYYHLYQTKHMSYPGPGYGSATVIVKPGDTGDKIAAQLVNKQVVGSIDSWASFVQNQPNTLQPGEYRMLLHMSNAGAWARLTNAKYRVNSTVTIVDGRRLSVTLAALAKESGIPLSQFQSAAKDTAALGLPSYAKGNLEGYLYPATYDIVPGTTTAPQILKMAVHQFNVEAAKLNLAAGARKTGFTETHIIIGASLLEAEVHPKYYADVAEVIDNRLNSGMTLGLDSTVAYATGKYIYNLSSSDLKVNSPYNTFTHVGLPPGPIDSPDAAAIEAFLHPSTGHNWTYFVTVNKQGLTRFTNSVSQFNAWSQLAKQNGV